MRTPFNPADLGAQKEIVKAGIFPAAFRRVVGAEQKLARGRLPEGEFRFSAVPFEPSSVRL